MTPAIVVVVVVGVLGLAPATPSEERLLATLAATDDSQERSAILLRAGDMALARNDWEAAIARFGRALVLSHDAPTRVLALRGLGSAKLESGHLREAEEAFQSALGTATGVVRLELEAKLVVVRHRRTLRLLDGVAAVLFVFAGVLVPVWRLRGRPIRRRLPFVVAWAWPIYVLFVGVGLHREYAVGVALAVMAVGSLLLMALWALAPAPRSMVALALSVVGLLSANAGLFFLAARAGGLIDRLLAAPM